MPIYFTKTIALRATPWGLCPQTPKDSAQQNSGARIQHPEALNWSAERPENPKSQVAEPAVRDVDDAGAAEQIFCFVYKSTICQQNTLTRCKVFLRLYYIRCLIRCCQPLHYIADHIQCTAHGLARGKTTNRGRRANPRLLIVRPLSIRRVSAPWIAALVGM